MCVPEHMEHMGCVPLEHTLSCVPNLEHKASCVSKMVDFSNTPRTLPILDLGLDSRWQGGDFGTPDIPDFSDYKYSNSKMQFENAIFLNVK